MSSDSSLSGKVVPGDGRGTKLGCPTANLQLDNPNHRPPDGVYACTAQIKSEKKNYLATMHVGPRPTFPEAKPTIEVHLIDFPHQPLYGKKLQIANITRLRGIIKFHSPQALASAIAEDISNAKAMLSKSHE